MVIMGSHCFSLLSTHYLLWRQHPGFPLGHCSASIIPFALGRADPTPSFEGGHVGSRTSHHHGQGAELMGGPCPKFWEANTGGESRLPPEDKAIGGESRDERRRETPDVHGSLGQATPEGSQQICFGVLRYLNQTPLVCLSPSALCFCCLLMERTLSY